MNREDKRRNKEHCKDMPLDIKLQCWFNRNKEEIAAVTGAVLSSVVTAVLLTILQLIHK